MSTVIWPGSTYTTAMRIPGPKNLMNFWSDWDGMGQHMRMERALASPQSTHTRVPVDDDLPVAAAAVACLEGRHGGPPHYPAHDPEASTHPKAAPSFPSPSPALPPFSFASPPAHLPPAHRLIELN